MYPSLTAQAVNNTWKFICLCVGGIFTSRSTLVLYFLLHVALFPLFFFVHLSRTCIHLLLPVGDFPSSVFCSFLNLAWYTFFPLNLLLRALNHCGGVEQHKAGRRSPTKEVIEEHLASESGKGLWMQALPSQEICYFLFGLVTNARCGHCYTPEHRIDWLLGDPPAFQHMEPAPFHLGGSVSFSVDEGRLWLQSQMSWRSSFLVCAELVWLIIFDTSQGRERYSGWESKNTFQVGFLFCILWIWWIFFPLSCHSLLINAFPPLNF